MQNQGSHTLGLSHAPQSHKWQCLVLCGHIHLEVPGDNEILKHQTSLTCGIYIGLFQYAMMFYVCTSLEGIAGNGVPIGACKITPFLSPMANLCVTLHVATFFTSMLHPSSCQKVQLCNCDVNMTSAKTDMWLSC